MSRMIINGDSNQVVAAMKADSIDAIVSDPPYGWAFMGKKWDYDIPPVSLWKECLRVLKPGGHILIACGTRTQHRMCSNIEDAGFEIRDIVAYIYGSGFPKSTNIGKAIDKAAGTERKAVGMRNPHLDGGKRKKHETGGNKDINIKKYGKYNCIKLIDGCVPITAPATPEAELWDGWGTALKPAMELWTLARKPLAERTIAANVLKHGCGGINIDDCKVGSEPSGRFPANIIHDGSEEVLEHFPADCSSGGGRKGEGGKRIYRNGSSMLRSKDDKTGWQYDAERDEWYMLNSSAYPDSGSAARFFYCAKASPSERNAGCEGLPEKTNPKLCDTGYESETRMDGKPCAKARNHHPTVKPIALMRYLCRMITPGGIILDPFAGSGSTGIAAVIEGFDFIGIEREFDYCRIAEARIRHHGMKHHGMFSAINSVNSKIL